MYIKSCTVVLLAILGCDVGLYSHPAPNHRDVQEKNIVIIGTAWNAKGGAVVLTKKDEVYYLGGLEAWEKKFYGKKVKVTGKLVLVNHPKRGKDEPLVQEMEGTQRIIEKAKWELVK